VARNRIHAHAQDHRIVPLILGQIFLELVRLHGAAGGHVLGIEVQHHPLAAGTDLGGRGVALLPRAAKKNRRLLSNPQALHRRRARALRSANTPAMAAISSTAKIAKRDVDIDRPSSLRTFFIRGIFGRFHAEAGTEVTFLMKIGCWGRGVLYCGEAATIAISGGVRGSNNCLAIQRSESVRIRVPDTSRAPRAWPQSSPRR